MFVVCCLLVVVVGECVSFIGVGCCMFSGGCWMFVVVVCVFVCCCLRLLASRWLFVVVCWLRFVVRCCVLFIISCSLCVGVCCCCSSCGVSLVLFVA